ncbi:MFS transporter [archaeon]|nr:MFS transporter [archaeon]
MVKHSDITRKIVVSGKLRKPDVADETARKNMRYSTSEGVFNSSSDSINNTFLTPFAMSMGATSAEVGILSAAQNLASTLSQIPGAMLTEYVDRKTIWIFAQTFGKILLWIPLLLLPFLGISNPVSIFIMIAFLISFATGVRRPAWTSLMGDVIPASIRGRYFGSRNMILGVAGIAMTLVGGYIVSNYGFSTIFIIYIVLNLAAIPFFLRMIEPPSKRIYHYKHRISIKPSNWPSAIRANRGLSIFTAFLGIMYFSTTIASPFYTVYMLRDLHINYLIFAVLTTVGAAAHIVTYKYWGKLIDRFGSRSILFITASLSIFTPLLWILSSNPLSIAILLVFDGFIWAGFDQVAFTFLLDIIPAERRPQYIANHNFFVGIGIFMGALTGGVLATIFETQTLFIFAGLHVLFLISFLLRLVPLVLLTKLPYMDVRQTDIVPVKYVFMQAMTVEPVKDINNLIHYTFRYPYEIEKEFMRDIRKIKYKIRMKTA